MNRPQYDALLIVSFGGPERPEDVIPFLENVLRGKPIPRERMFEVAEHYYEFNGISPINAQNRDLIRTLREELDTHGPPLPIYWGNRNWHPLLADTLRQMRDHGIQQALAFVTAGYSSYSSCRQYLENLSDAQSEVGAGAPQIDKLRVFYNHPRFIEATAEQILNSLKQIPTDRRPNTRLVYTAHSIPQAMATNCSYVEQLNEACRLVGQRVGPFPWQLVYQSRSGSPHQPWLEPDVGDYLRELSNQEKVTDVLIMPIGFISDHMEVLFDLDTEARQLCDNLGLNMVRAKTVSTHPGFVKMIRELILEQTAGGEKQTLGTYPPSHDICPDHCCPSGHMTTRGSQ